MQDTTNPNRFEVASDLYATDNGPTCPHCHVCPLWVIAVAPGQTSIAQCAACHHGVNFTAPAGSPDIYEVKAALAEALKPRYAVFSAGAGVDAFEGYFTDRAEAVALAEQIAGRSAPRAYVRIGGEVVYSASAHRAGEGGPL